MSSSSNYTPTSFRRWSQNAKALNDPETRRVYEAMLDCWQQAIDLTGHCTPETLEPLFVGLTYHRIAVWRDAAAIARQLS